MLPTQARKMRTYWQPSFAHTDKLLLKGSLMGLETFAHLTLPVSPTSPFLLVILPNLLWRLNLSLESFL